MSSNKLFANTAFGSNSSSPGFISTIVAAPSSGGTVVADNMPPNSLASPATMLTIAEDRALVAQELAARSSLISSLSSPLEAAQHQLNAASNGAANLMNQHDIMADLTPRLPSIHGSLWSVVHVAKSDMPASSPLSQSAPYLNPVAPMTSHGI